MGPNDSRFGSGNVADIRHYIKLGPLGRSFAADERHVLLIDEIDKADLEFPNDLLLELDEYWLREQNELRKKPSTSDLIDWISALLHSGVSLDKVEEHIPFVGALLKKEQDVDALSTYDSKGGRYPKKWEELGPRYNQ